VCNFIHRYLTFITTANSFIYEQRTSNQYFDSSTCNKDNHFIRLMTNVCKKVLLPFPFRMILTTKFSFILRNYHNSPATIMTRSIISYHSLTYFLCPQSRSRRISFIFQYLGGEQYHQKLQKLLENSFLSNAHDTDLHAVIHYLRSCSLLLV